MEHADRAVDQGSGPNLQPVDGENIAYQHFLEVFSFRYRFAHGENRGPRRNGVTDADDGLLRNASVMRLDGRKNGCSQESETEAGPIRSSPMRIETIKHRNGAAEGGDLRQGEIHKNDPALHHVNAQISVDASENEAGDEGRQ